MALGLQGAQRLQLVVGRTAATRIRNTQRLRHAVHRALAVAREHLHTQARRLERVHAGLRVTAQRLGQRKSGNPALRVAQHHLGVRVGRAGQAAKRRRAQAQVAGQSASATHGTAGKHLCRSARRRFAVLRLQLAAQALTRHFHRASAGPARAVALLRTRLDQRARGRVQRMACQRTGPGQRLRL